MCMRVCVHARLEGQLSTRVRTLRYRCFTVAGYFEGSTTSTNV